jgi:hypothetical protein
MSDCAFGKNLKRWSELKHYRAINTKSLVVLVNWKEEKDWEEIKIKVMGVDCI